jgi:membrane-associated PAP2 superfamily phosphatase
MRSATRRQAAPAEVGWLTVALLVMVGGWDASGLDLPLASLAGSAAGFPWREHWLLSTVAHEGGRRLAWLLALVLCLGVWWPLGPLRRIDLADRLQLAVTILVGVLVVSLLKTGSRTSCPWDLADFGGLARYVSHWSLHPDGGTGRCFPAGHAAAGFTFAGGYFAWRRTDARTARVWLATAFGAGLLLGLAQQWRGAHFMSHTLWSALVCWTTAWLVDALWPRARFLEGS